MVYSNQVLAVSTSVVTLTVPTLGFPTAAIISVETNPIRLTLDGVDPNNSTKNGLYLGVGTIFRITGRDMARAKMIRADSSNASVSVNYEQAD